MANEQVVPAPNGTPYRFGLFSVLDFAVDPDERFNIAGITWQSQGCGGPGVTVNSCIDPDVDPLTPEPPCSVQAFDPFTVYVYETDSLGSASMADMRETVRQRLLAAEQFGAEMQMSTMMLDAATPIAVTVGSDPASKVAAAVAVVEQELATMTGNTGVIHMSRFAASLVSDQLTVQGGKLVTKLGTPVAAYGGWKDYSTFTPLGLWMANPEAFGAPTIITGTGPLVGYRGALELDEATPELKINDASIIAQRGYALGWDCGVVAAQAAL